MTLHPMSSDLLSGEDIQKCSVFVSAINAVGMYKWALLYICFTTFYKKSAKSKREHLFLKFFKPKVV